MTPSIEGAGAAVKWLPLKEYDGLARLCRWCMFSHAPKVIGPQRCRNIVITESGRQLLREIRAAEKGTVVTRVESHGFSFVRTSVA